jgi:hypothetical protein
MALTMNGAAEDPTMVIHPAGHSSGSAGCPLPGNTPAGYPTARHGRLWAGLSSRTGLHRSARPSEREARSMPWITPGPYQLNRDICGIGL